MYVQLWLAPLRLSGETRNQPWIASTPQVPSEARFSLVVLLRSEISTLLRDSSSLADPEKVIGPPGATTRVGAVVGGTIEEGALIDTVGAWPSSLTIHERSPVSRSDWPAESTARAWAFQVPSWAR